MTDSHLLHQLPGAGWHPEDFKAELRKRFGTLSNVAKSLNVTRQAISGVMLNPHASIKLERRIADLIGVHPYAIWTDRWMPDGKPVPRSKRTKNVRFVQKNDI